MNFQVCYVVISDQNDAYTEMAYISSGMLRSLYPNIKITLLTDEASHRYIAGHRTQILDQVDDTVCLETNQKHPMARSRFLKTAMRGEVAGDFVYLDVDAIPVRRFDAMTQPGERFAAVLDHNGAKPHFPNWVNPVFDELEWRRPLPQYVNAGVMYFPDTPPMQALGAEWHRRWQQTAALGEFRDQLSLNSALDALGIDIQIMSYRYNAMFRQTPLVAAWRPKVLHFFANNALPEENTVFYALLQRVQQGDRIDWKAERQKIASHGPWLDEHKGMKLNFVTGQYGTVARLAAKRLLRDLPLSTKLRGLFS